MLSLIRGILSDHLKKLGDVIVARINETTDLFVMEFISSEKCLFF